MWSTACLSPSPIHITSQLKWLFSLCSAMLEVHSFYSRHIREKYVWPLYTHPLQYMYDFNRCIVIAEDKRNSPIWVQEQVEDVEAESWTKVSTQSVSVDTRIPSLTFHLVFEMMADSLGVDVSTLYIQVCPTARHFSSHYLRSGRLGLYSQGACARAEFQQLLT